MFYLRISALIAGTVAWRPSGLWQAIGALALEPKRMVTEMTKRSRAATAAAISALFSLIVSITTVQKMFIKLEVPKGISIQLDTSGGTKTL